MSYYVIDDELQQVQTRLVGLKRSFIGVKRSFKAAYIPGSLERVIFSFVPFVVP